MGREQFFCDTGWQQFEHFCCESRNFTSILFPRDTCLPKTALEPEVGTPPDTTLATSWQSLLLPPGDVSGYVTNVLSRDLKLSGVVAGLSNGEVGSTQRFFLITFSPYFIFWKSRNVTVLHYIFAYVNVLFMLFFYWGAAPNFSFKVA